MDAGEERTLPRMRKINIVYILLYFIAQQRADGFDPLEKYHFEVNQKNLFEMGETFAGQAYFRPVIENIHSPISRGYPYSLQGKVSAHYQNDFSFRLDGDLQLPINQYLWFQWNFRAANSADILSGYTGLERESVGDFRGDMVYGAINFQT